NFIAQTAKVCKSRLFVTKEVLICTVRLAHERSECDKHGARKDYFSRRLINSGFSPHCAIKHI
ncbi:hypothetical protein TSAR_012309, partial [Trichomalopsis sarcophagae]